MENNYKSRRRNRLLTFYRIRLGLSQLIYKPYLNLLWLPVGIVTIFLLASKDKLLSLFNAPELLQPLYRGAVFALSILLPIIIIFAVLDAIGTLTARKPEADLEEIFNDYELRNGTPILIDKMKLKGSKVTVLEFYSAIPLNTWLERQEEISDLMNVRILEKPKYGGKSNGRRILLITAPGRENEPREALYDEEF